ncbi:MAG: DUF2975 domain-containing protein [Actinomycetales bacterium]|nr:DUF2975 domain-containing protein [Actinomycetales bacterium]
MHKSTTLALRVALGAVLLGTLFSQVLLIPLLAAEAAWEAPEVAYLRWPYTAAAIAVVLCVQVAVVCVWRLTAFVRRGSIFSARAFGWVDRIIGAVLAAVVILAAMFVHLTAINAMPPAVLFFLTGGVVAGLCLALLVVVMRALLVRATELESDLSEVI